MANMPAMIEEHRKERQAARAGRRPEQRPVPLVPEVLFVCVFVCLCVYVYV
jgi:hypothetical protein